MERNQRQQDFMILMLEKMVDQDISTLLTNTDLIETAAGMVVFDERITLGELMDLGQSFVDIEPDHVIQHVLPVTDGWGRGGSRCSNSPAKAKLLSKCFVVKR